MSLEKTKLLAFSGLIAIIAINGCAGVKFASAPHDNLPDQYINRSILDPSVQSYIFEQLPGSIILIKKNQNPALIGFVTPPGFKASVIPITADESLNYYHSIITSKVSTKANYLAFAADFSTDDMAELTLVDVARAGIDINATTFPQITDGLTAWVATHPLADTSEHRIWISSTVLTSRVYNIGTKINADASGQVGTVVGVSGNVYNTNTTAFKSTIISFISFDVDKLINQNLNAAKTKQDTSKILTGAVSPKRFKEKIDAMAIKGLVLKGDLVNKISN